MMKLAEWMLGVEVQAVFPHIGLRRAHVHRLVIVGVCCAAAVTIATAIWASRAITASASSHRRCRRSRSNRTGGLTVLVEVVALPAGHGCRHAL